MSTKSRQRPPENVKTITRPPRSDKAPRLGGTYGTSPNSASRGKQGRG